MEIQYKNGVRMKSANIRMKKGISPLIATVLLIAFTVAVAAIISTWLTTFTTTSTESVKEKADIELHCTYGGISVTYLSYCNGYLSGIVENTNLIDIGNVTLQVFYTNMSSLSVPLNISIKQREQASFNVSSVGSNYDRLHFYTNCSSVYDNAARTDVTAC